MLLDDPGVLAAFVTAFVGGFFLIAATWLQTRKTRKETAVTRAENEAQHGRSAELLRHLADEVGQLAGRTDGGFERMDARFDEHDNRLGALELVRLNELLAANPAPDVDAPAILEPPHE